MQGMAGHVGAAVRGRAGQGRAGQGKAGQGRVGHGMAGQGGVAKDREGAWDWRAWQGRAELSTSRMDPRVGSGHDFAGFWRVG